MSCISYYLLYVHRLSSYSLGSLATEVLITTARTWYPTYYTTLPDHDVCASSFKIKLEFHVNEKGWVHIVVLSMIKCQIRGISVYSSFCVCAKRHIAVIIIILSYIVC